MLESKYQAELIKKLKRLFPDCFVLKNDSGYLQGVPDLILLWEDRWATLEVKVDEDSPERPNQRWYVNRMDEMSFSAFIYPGNEEEVLNALQRQFTTRRKARLSQRK